jgi:hypothetical protein
MDWKNERCCENELPNYTALMYSLREKCQSPPRKHTPISDRKRYTPTDCFETYPFPPDWESNPALEEAGHRYYEYRAALMVRNNEGLTKTYSRFHSPEETSPDIAQMRRLHAAMDTAVVTAYGWNDLLPHLRCEFLLDYEDEEDPGTAEPPPNAAAKSPGASAGPTTSATKSWPAPSNSTPKEPKKSVWQRNWHPKAASVNAPRQPRTTSPSNHERHSHHCQEAVFSSPAALYKFSSFVGVQTMLENSCIWR